MSIRHDWYQSEEYVKVTVLVKNAVEKNYSVEIEPNRVILNVGDYNLTLNLFKTINAEKSNHKATAHKIEITLYKIIGDRWDALEKKVVEEPVELPKVKNWDKVASEFEQKEEAEGNKSEDALQSLFQKIYMDSTPEVRKAMDKSYSESSGTVLSTNWNEVSENKVPVKPADGVEFKKW